MDFLTSSVLSGMLYDGFKEGIAITTDFLKGKLQGWLVDDALLDKLTEKVNALELRDYGEHVIERELKKSLELQNILKQIKPEQNTNIGSVTQSHSGSGDNVVGNKTVHHK
ncbi:GapS6a family protein [Shewanella oncorhynchi]|uniref:GapS6a family protein n=1 Tax=Shewanella oncorhynchi TaxID=2726434 RepID=UPI003D7B94EB